MKIPIILILTLAAAFAGGCGGGSDAESAKQSDSTVSHDAVEAALATAEDFFHAADNVKAEAVLTRLIDRAPRDARARELYAMVLMSRASDAREQGDAEAERELVGKAHEQYLVLLELHPDSAGLRQSAGEVAQMAGLPDQALAHYQTAQRLDPRDSKSPFFAAQVLIEMRRLDEAQAALERCLALDADEPMAHASLANLLAERGEFEKAIQSITEARTIDPAPVAYRLIEASIHRRAGEPRRALELLMHLSERDRAREVVASELAAAFKALGEPHRAAEAWALVYRANPSGPFARTAAARAGRALVEAGEREQAWTWLRQARLAPGNGLEDGKADEVTELERAIAEAVSQ